MQKLSSVLIIDDEEDICNLIAGILQDEGYTPYTASHSDAAMQMLDQHLPDLVVLDIWLEGSPIDGLEILERIIEKNPLLPVIMVSGHGTIETAVQALRLGAYDFIEKPFNSDRLLVMAERALESSDLKKENKALKSSHTPSELNLHGTSPVVRGLEQGLKKVAKTNSRVLFNGESGTGKTAAAKFIHDHSSRSDGNFVVVNCATLNPDRFEVELFGAEKGVIAPYSTKGLLSESHQGTLLLDEVADMPLATQAKFMSVLQENRYQSIGSNTYYDVDVRVIATTRKDLSLEIQNNRFREDLYYRLSVVPFLIPPLREYKDDIAAYINEFIQQLADKEGRSAFKLSDECYHILSRYEWPGNMRQLRNCIEWLFAMHSHADNITASMLPPDIKQGSDDTDTSQASGGIDNLLKYKLKDARKLFERDYLAAQLHAHDGNVSKVAEQVGMERSALHRKIKQLQIG